MQNETDKMELIDRPRSLGKWDSNKRIMCKHEYFENKSRAEKTCTKCGLVKENHLIFPDKTPRIFGASDQTNKQRYGPPLNSLLPDIQMSTCIKKSETRNPALRKAIKWDSRYGWKQTNILQAISEIRRVSSVLSIPEWVQIEASQIYRKMRKLGFLKGRTTVGMISGCLYYSLCKADIPIPKKELCKVMEISLHSINQNYSLILQELHLKSPVIHPKFYVNRFLNILRISSNVNRDCLKILGLYRRVYQFSGMDPKGIAGGVIYYMVVQKKLEITQQEIARVCQISDVTLRKNYYRIKSMVKKIKKHHISKKFK